VADQFGVSEEQVRRDYVISHLLALISDELAGEILFFGGTALARTHLLNGRLSEDLDLIAVSPRRDVATALDRLLPRGASRATGALRWNPSLSAVRDTAAAALEGPHGVRLKVQLLRGEHYAAWPTERRALHQRYADAPAATLSVPTRAAFTAWKTATWADRKAPRDLWDLHALAGLGAVDRDALALWPADDAGRPALLYRRADALYVADDERALDALEEARDALLAAGDRETAAEAELSISRIWWHRGQKSEAAAHEARAAELAGSEPSPATARVIASVARSTTIGGDPEEGLRLAREALAMAEALELDQLRAHALCTVGLSKNSLGDPTGADDTQRALELAVAANSPQAGSIANNVAIGAWGALDMRRAGELFEEGLKIAERFGDAAGIRFLRGQCAAMALMLGRWDEALGASEEFIAECEAGSPHYLESSVRLNRAHIRAARGDVEGALVDWRRAVELARAAGDPQQVLPLGEAAEGLEGHGFVAEARTLATEVVEFARRYPGDAAWALPFGFLLSRVSIGFEREVREALPHDPWPQWRDLALACLDRNFVRAAEIWAEAGSPTWEARLRVRAAEELIETGRRAEGEAQARKAHEFYRSVGATFFVDRCEALLRQAKSA